MSCKHTNVTLDGNTDNYVCEDCGEVLGSTHDHDGVDYDDHDYGSEIPEEDDPDDYF